MRQLVISISRHWNEWILQTAAIPPLLLIIGKVLKYFCINKGNGNTILEIWHPKNPDYNKDKVNN